MKQARPRGQIWLRTPFDVLASPACEECGAITRFVGLESHPINDSSDLCTYTCDVCGHLQTGVLARNDKQNGIGSAHPLDEGG